MVSSVAPVLIVSRVDLLSAMRGARETAGPKSRLTTEAMVAAQIVLAVVVLSAAGLIVRSLVKLERADLVIDPTRVLIGELSFRSDLVDGKEKQHALLDRILAEVRALPEVAEGRVDSRAAVSRCAFSLKTSLTLQRTASTDFDRCDAAIGCTDSKLITWLVAIEPDVSSSLRRILLQRLPFRLTPRNFELEIR